MKLYSPEEKEVVRIDIKGGKGNSSCITVIDTDIYHAIDFVKHSLKEYLIKTTGVNHGKKLTISCYVAKGNKKGKSKSVTMYGLSAKFVKELLISKL